MSAAPDDLAGLRKLAEKATQGPWHVDKYDCYVWGPKGEMVADRGCVDLPEGAVIRARGTGGGLPIAANMAHVAAFNPETALRLLDAIESLQRQLSDAELRLDEARATIADVDLLRSAAERQLSEARAENAKQKTWLQIAAGESAMLRQLHVDYEEAERQLSDSRAAEERLRAELSALQNPPDKALWAGVDGWTAAALDSSLPYGAARTMRCARQAWAATVAALSPPPRTEE